MGLLGYGFVGLWLSCIFLVQFQDGGKMFNGFRFNGNCIGDCCWFCGGGGEFVMGINVWVMDWS